MALINLNRLNNAISKVGQVELEDKPRVKEVYNLLVQDVMDELRSEQENLFATTTPSDLLLLRKAVEEEAQKVMKKYFKQRARAKKKISI